MILAALIANDALSLFWLFGSPLLSCVEEFCGISLSFAFHANQERHAGFRSAVADAIWDNFRNARYSERIPQAGAQ
jgi:hypothetical protein